MAKKSKSSAGKIDIGITSEDREKIAGGLAHLLADTYTLYLATHNFHWNVTGPMFNTLHTMFMAQYTELWNAVDPIAERIRALGFPAPGTYSQFGKLSSIREVEGVPSALQMVAILVKGHEAVAKTARSIFPVADESNDQPTADLLTQRMDIHEKNGVDAAQHLGVVVVIEAGEVPATRSRDARYSLSASPKLMPTVL